ncbi:hypothetical protein SPKIRA_05290 [Sphingomonas paucimobilis]|nr:hypothetical protein SPKIRA_05290 [Sphingomonas paucimobilis]
MRATRTYIERHGKPVALYSDKHSAFRNNTASANGDGMTHLGRALHALNIEIICANSPQAKGRVERANGTLQDRLVKAMRLEGISTIEEANAFLPAYMARHNRQFARTPFDPRDLHRPLAPHENIEAEMVWREQRTVTAALTLHYNKALFILEPNRVSQALARKRVDVCEFPDGRIEIRHDGQALPYRVFDKMQRVNQGSGGRQQASRRGAGDGAAPAGNGTTPPQAEQQRAGADRPDWRYVRRLGCSDCIEGGSPHALHAQAEAWTAPSQHGTRRAWTGRIRGPRSEHAASGTCLTACCSSVTGPAAGAAGP